jgi:hypothetical protein
MEKRGESSASSIEMITNRGRSLLGNIINIYDSAVPMLIPDTKTYFKQQLEKGKCRLRQGKGRSDLPEPDVPCLL